MLVVRQGYGCDCDGVSHLTGSITHDAERSTVRGVTQAFLDSIESLVGDRPQTCPWRALYHPLVIEVLDLRVLGEHNLAIARTGFDPPAILLDAVAIFEGARTKTLNANLERQRENAKKQQ